MLFDKSDLGKLVERLVLQRDEAVCELSALKLEMDRSGEDLSNAKKDYDILGDRFDAAEKEVESLKWKLEVAPNRDSIIEEFRSSSEMQEILEAFRETAVKDYLESPDYKEKLDLIAKQLMRGPEFQKAVGEKSKLVIPYLVECCRMYFKDDSERPQEGFEMFFVEWKKQVIVEKAKRRAAEKEAVDISL